MSHKAEVLRGISSGNAGAIGADVCSNVEFAEKKLRVLALAGKFRECDTAATSPPSCA
jgi:hypothetical protein